MFFLIFGCTEKTTFKNIDIATFKEIISLHPKTKRCRWHYDEMLISASKNNYFNLQYICLPSDDYRGSELEVTISVSINKDYFKPNTDILLFIKQQQKRTKTIRDRPRFSKGLDLKMFMHLKNTVSLNDFSMAANDSSYGLYSIIALHEAVNVLEIQAEEQYQLARTETDWLRVHSQELDDYTAAADILMRRNNQGQATVPD